MLLLKPAIIRPKTRLKITPAVLNSFKFLNKKKYWIGNTNNKLQVGRSAIKHKKFFVKPEHVSVSRSIRFTSPFVITTFSNFRRELKEFCFAKNIYNVELYLNSINLYYPGFKIYPLCNLKFIGSNKQLLGQIIELQYVPLNLPICNVYNALNTRITYSRSSGTVSIRRKIIRQSKLVVVTLPSKNNKLLPSTTLCMFGSVTNMFVNKVVEGGWGLSPFPKKLIAVRGVAKNPVDHPNGGRTKAKQPEKSPWGWIAKQSK